MELDVPLAHGENPAVIAAIAAAEESATTADYDSLDYCCQHMDRCGHANLCAPLAGITVILYLLLFYIPMLLLIASAIFFFVFGCVLCYYNRNALWYRMHSLHLVGEARREVLNDKYLPTDGVFRDWTGASGTFTSEESNSENENKQSVQWVKQSVHFTFSRLQIMDNQIWKISGRSADGTFVIRSGLIAESGKAYWIDQYYDSDDQKRIMLTLTRGYFDYNTDRFVMGTWKDNQGYTGTYPTLKREQKYAEQWSNIQEDSEPEAAETTV